MATDIGVIANTLQTARAVFRLEVLRFETALCFPLYIHSPHRIASSVPALLLLDYPQ